MNNVDFINPNTFAVHLTGPDGQSIKVRAKQRVSLPGYFKKYCSKGFLREAVSAPNQATEAPTIIQAKVNHPISESPEAIEARRAKRDQMAKIRKMALMAKITRSAHHQPPPIQRMPIQKNISHKVVGKTSNTNAQDLFQANLGRNNFPISNNIGVGILSYNRGDSLRRLVDSILRFTDLRRTTVFISDDGSTDQATISYLQELETNPNFVVLQNSVQLGVAGNSNRLLRCLARFKYGILLNDDVEIMSRDWEYFYPEAMKRTSMHHFVYRQPGVYGADAGNKLVKDGVELLKVADKPHGAVLAFDHNHLATVGFFDEGYGLYGMEHVDWSQKAYELGLQDPGFFDVAGSAAMFKVHADESAVADRQILFQAARERFATRNKKPCLASDASVVPEIAYVIPFRNFERTGSIVTVVNNIRAQRYPVINISIVEQDAVSKIDLNAYTPVRYHLAPAENQLFNKAKAFNVGVASLKCTNVVLHDADIIAQGHYTKEIAAALSEFESCHIGKTVMYASQDATAIINDSEIIDDKVVCERTVGYYEGGSIACTVGAYWKVGGFNEDFWGYGVEDCDFYARLSGGSKWSENRIFDFLHLWHSRVEGWHEAHEKNKLIEIGLKRNTIQERISLQRQQLVRIGYADKLQGSL